MVVTIFGYGSLMELDSLRETCPSARNLRVGKLDGYIRVFNLVSVKRIREKICTEESKEIAVVSVRAKEGSTSLGVMFDIDEDQVAAYKLRERGYKFCTVPVIELDTSKEFNCLLCYENNEEDYKLKYKSQEEFHQQIGQFYSGQIWNRQDIFPIRRYLSSIRRASFLLGGQNLHSHILDNSYLSNGSATIRQYLRSKPQAAFVDSFWDLSDLLLTDDDLMLFENCDIFDKLYLSHNKLKIFPIKWLASNLKELDLSCNEIEIIPEEIKTCKSLEILNLSDNKISIFPDLIIEIPQLKLLNLERNNIATIPNSIKALEYLTITI